MQKKANTLQTLHIYIKTLIYQGLCVAKWCFTLCRIVQDCAVKGFQGGFFTKCSQSACKVPAQSCTMLQSAVKCVKWFKVLHIKGYTMVSCKVCRVWGYNSKKHFAELCREWDKNSNETMKTAEERERTERTGLTASMCHHDIRLTAFMGAVVYQIA